jgi:hypothetical protein
MDLRSSDGDNAVHVSVGVSDTNVVIYYFQDWIVVEDGFEAYVKELEASGAYKALHVVKVTDKSKRLQGSNIPVPRSKLENVFGVAPSTDTVTAKSCEIKIHFKHRFVEVWLEFEQPFYRVIPPDLQSNTETVRPELQMF